MWNPDDQWLPPDMRAALSVKPPAKRWFSVGRTDTHCGHVAHWMQLGHLRAGWWWRKGHTRKPRLLSRWNNVFMSAGDWQLDLWWVSVAWKSA